MRAPLTTSLTIATALLISACTNDTQEQQSSAVSAQQPAQVDAKSAKPHSTAAQEVVIQPVELSKGVIMNQGTVRYLNLEGGFWGIITDDGRKILPENLPSEHRKDGLRLSFSSKEVKGMMTIQQWGTLSTLDNIKVIGQVESQGNDPRI
ncbi:hypothetical protein [Shewanella sp. Scap07]|uniref:hypothetical protein n=1 Tax=Shewanella sp. Scap07 TaxID=2589987 RepID=UPI0021195C1C|nr:hypothetical protein [Shewanella sp. Scap07]